MADRFDIVVAPRGTGRDSTEKSNHRHGLLRARRKRPRGSGTAEQRDELATFHA
jgi:hypothetical protein